MSSRPLSERRRVGALGALLLLVGCGYHPAGRIWPARLGRVQVVLPEAPTLGEPELPRMLALELVRQLARAGVDAVTSAPARARLQSKLVALATTDSPLGPSGDRVAARALRLRLELRLSEAEGDRTLWRSGLLEVEELWSLGSSAELSEASRRRTLQRLAARAAEQVVELLETAPPP